MTLTVKKLPYNLKVARCKYCGRKWDHNKGEKTCDGCGGPYTRPAGTIFGEPVEVNDALLNFMSANQHAANILYGYVVNKPDFYAKTICGGDR